MLYKPFGQLGFDVSILGFGVMRLPQKNNSIDTEQAKSMLDFAIESGINYFDTAYFYHEGKSEEFLGCNLSPAQRQKIKLATKLPCWLVKRKEDFDNFLNAQLKRLKTSWVDFYLLHSLGAESWEKIKQLDILNWAEKARASGRFRWLGFSFHDKYEVFTKIIDAYNWDMCQIQYNYMDIENQAGQAGLKYAASKNIPVVIMEPLLGGKLAGNLPAGIMEIFNKAKINRSIVEWALGWLWSQNEVTTVLSGMSTLEQLKENIELASNFKSFCEEDESVIQKVRQELKKLAVIACTRCSYCMPCPQGVDIPANLNVYNEALVYNIEAARGTYSWWQTAFEKQKIFDTDIRALNCIQCGVCEKKCPQTIPISRWMPIIHSVLGENKALVKKI